MALSVYPPTIYINDQEPARNDTNLNKTENALAAVTDEAILLRSEMDDLPDPLTDEEIKIAYENNTDTNAFTDEEKQEIVSNTALIQLNTTSIANLATAQGIVEGVQVSGEVFSPIPSTFTQLPFNVTTVSTDTNVFECDAVTNTCEFKTNASFNFMNTISVKANTVQPRVIQFRIVNVANDAVIYEREANIEIALNDIADLQMLGLLTIGKNGMPSAPVTLRMEVREVESSYSMVSFYSIMMSSSSYDGETNHSGLSGRDLADSHPMSAVTGLTSSLENKVDARYPLSPEWDGTLLTELTTPKLSEVGIPAGQLNQIAYIYPDGTIVGESDKGKFTKYANGEATLRPIFSVTDSIASGATTDATITLPLTLIYENNESSVASTFGTFDSSGAVHVSKCYVDSATTFTMAIRNESAASRTYVYKTALIQGRWKI